MKGVILAGGLGTRLYPLTHVTNKHLLPVYDRPMIYFPIQALVKAGIKDLLIVTSGPHVGHFLGMLKNGDQFGLEHLEYAHQEKPDGGISDALSLAESFADEGPICVILGDNIFGFDLSESVKEFEQEAKGARVFGIEMEKNVSQYGVIELDNEGNIITIEEKPEHPKSNIAQTGIYMYDNTVFDRIRKLSPSARGELEVSDLNNLYLKDNVLKCGLIDWWIDAGTSFDELLRAGNQVAEKIKVGTLPRLEEKE
ncbi:MAG: sugar phosphate nucleotidyltransferase [Patescibacteria group bacterium]